MYDTRKVVIVGAGHVGSHVALALIQSGEADDIVLIDIDKDKAVGQAFDLDDAVTGAACGRDTVIRAGGYEELNDADILVGLWSGKQAVVSARERAWKHTDLFALSAILPGMPAVPYRDFVSENTVIRDLSPGRRYVLTAVPLRM